MKWLQSILRSFSSLLMLHDVTVRSLLDSLMLILQKSADINLSCCDKLIESTVHEENSDFKTLHWLKIIFWIISHHIYVFVYLVYLFSENISLIIEVSQFLVDLIFCTLWWTETVFSFVFLYDCGPTLDLMQNLSCKLMWQTEINGQYFPGNTQKSTSTSECRTVSLSMNQHQ